MTLREHISGVESVASLTGLGRLADRAALAAHRAETGTLDHDDRVALQDARSLLMQLQSFAGVTVPTRVALQDDGPHLSARRDVRSRVANERPSRCQRVRREADRVDRLDPREIRNRRPDSQRRSILRRPRRGDPQSNDVDGTARSGTETKMDERGLELVRGLIAGHIDSALRGQPKSHSGRGARLFDLHRRVIEQAEATVVDVEAKLQASDDDKTRRYAERALHRTLTEVETILPFLRPLMESVRRDDVPIGMRTSFRSWAAEQGVSREVAEGCLAHAVKGVEGAYQRSDLLAARAEIMERWARYVSGKGA